MSGHTDSSRRAPLLTPAQRQGVEYAGGPMIVLAGPGTGKTRVIVERIAHAIRERGVDPASILAITFTIKAAEEMRRRLAAELGDNRADQVRACTSHSFGRDLVSRFGDVLGFAETPRLIDGPVVRRTLRELARKLGSFPDLPTQGREGAVAETVRMIAACRNSDVTPARAGAFAEEWGRTIEARREPGSETDDGFLADVARHRRFADQAALYAAFEAECHRRGWMCIDELITLAIRLLRENPMAAAIVRQECRCVLFDEFQDANLSQIELLRVLCPPKSSPDLCVVGDDDQSIYRFRGADDRGFERFRKIWGEGVKLVRLDENHRSHDPIVRLAGVVMGHAPHRFDPTKVLRVADSRPEHASGPPIELVRLGQRRVEAGCGDDRVAGARGAADRGGGGAGGYAAGQDRGDREDEHGCGADPPGAGDRGDSRGVDRQGQPVRRSGRPGRAGVGDAADGSRGGVGGESRVVPPAGGAQRGGSGGAAPGVRGVGGAHDAGPVRGGRDARLGACLRRLAPRQRGACSGGRPGGGAVRADLRPALGGCCGGSGGSCGV
jgi:hypothetical protein